MTVAAAMRFFSVLGLGALLVLVAAFPALAEDVQGASTTPVPSRPSMVKVADRQIEAASRADASILLVGDSILFRWKAPEEMLGRTVMNFAIAGDRTENVLYRLNRASFSPHRFDATVLLIGTNNLKRDNSKQVAEGAEAILAKLKSAVNSERFLLLSILPRGKYMTSKRRKIIEANRLLADIAARHGATFVNVFDVFDKQCGTAEACHLFKDNLHPNDEGYRLLSAEILRNAKS